MELEFVRSLVVKNDTKIVLLVLDGLGGLPRNAAGPTALEAADTPHLDHLASQGICGLSQPVGPGITPGSGPGHLSLFGYDPVRYRIGRGVLSALGIGFDLTDRDVAARGNFCTLDSDGKVVDRRAGRIDTGTNKELCGRLQQITVDGTDVFVEPVKEHRFLLVLRGEELSGEVTDTDPQATGVPPGTPEATGSGGESTAAVVSDFLDQASRILEDQEKANMVLLRGFDRLPDWPGFEQAFGLRAAAIAGYPMYRGVARLVGMESLQPEAGFEARVDTLERSWDDFDFFYIHQKTIDSAGEDGDFDRRVQLIEAVDEQIPHIRELQPDVLIVTGDHSTPARLKQHSWHAVPVLLHSATCRPDGVTVFAEKNCLAGGLGPRLPAVDLMPLALGHAGRLAKFGA